MILDLTVPKEALLSMDGCQMIILREGCDQGAFSWAFLLTLSCSLLNVDDAYHRTSNFH